MVFRFVQRLIVDFIGIFFRVGVIWLAGVFYLSFLSRKQRDLYDLQSLLKRAETYGEWRAAALAIDRLQNKTAWREKIESHHYDHECIQHKLQQLNDLHTDDSVSVENRLRILRAGITRDLGGINNAELYQHCLEGTKYLIEEYQQALIREMDNVCDTDFPNLKLKQKFDFFYELRHSYGRTALLLSGGASMGMYHIGVIKALYTEGLLPRVISGSSVGSIIASLVCVLPEDDLDEMFKPDHWNLNAFGSSGTGAIKRKLMRFIKQGVIMNTMKLQNCVRENIGDLTFREAFQISGRVLNITVSGKYNGGLLNYITCPNVVIWSAACASCAVPYVYAPVELMSKDAEGNIVPYHSQSVKWSDGSVHADLPMARLSELFNVNHFIASQVNPHVVPFLKPTHEKQNLQASKSTVSGALFYLLKSELKHRVTQLAELGLIPGFLGGIHRVVQQRYYGDVTIVPPFSLQDYLNLFTNPTPQSIAVYTKKGMQATFPSIPLIRGHCRVEIALDRIYFKLRRRLIKQKRQLTSSAEERVSKLNHESL